VVRWCGADWLVLTVVCCSIVARRSKEQLGRRFFTNITPGYQLYPTVFLLPWTDPNAPGGWQQGGAGLSHVSAPASSRAADGLTAPTWAHVCGAHVNLLCP
jgi:hypothetical protein